MQKLRKAFFLSELKQAACLRCVTVVKGVETDWEGGLFGCNKSLFFKLLRIGTIEYRQRKQFLLRGGGSEKCGKRKLSLGGSRGRLALLFFEAAALELPVVSFFFIVATSGGVTLGCAESMLLVVVLAANAWSLTVESRTTRCSL
jgi:hypothetical protein